MRYKDKLLFSVKRDNLIAEKWIPTCFQQMRLLNISEHPVL